MKGFLLTLVVSAVAFVVLLLLLPDSMIAMSGDIVPQLAVGAFVGLINAGMLLFSAWLLDNLFKVTLTIGGWPASDFSLDTMIGAFVASIVLSILTSLVGHFVPD